MTTIPVVRYVPLRLAVAALVSISLLIPFALPLLKVDFPLKALVVPPASEHTDLNGGQAQSRPSGVPDSIVLAESNASSSASDVAGGASHSGGVSNAGAGKEALAFAPTANISEADPSKAGSASLATPFGLVDLAALIKPERDVIRGKWIKEPEYWLVQNTDPNQYNPGAAVRIPYMPSGGYTLKLRARRMRSGGGVEVPVLYGGKRFGLYLAGGWSGSRTAGIRPEIKSDANFFPTSDWHDVTVSVGPDGIVCEGDGGAHIAWRGDYASIEGESQDIPGAEGLYLKVWEAYDLKSILLIPSGTPSAGRSGRHGELTLAGRWEWRVNGAYKETIEFLDNGTVGGRQDGRWSSVSPSERRYEISWGAIKDTLVLSEDGDSAKGTNNKGDLIEGIRKQDSRASSWATIARPSLAQRLKGTKWINTNNARFEWNADDGALLHNGVQRQWRQIASDRVEVVYSEDHKDILIFDDALQTFDQVVRGVRIEFTGKRQ